MTQLSYKDLNTLVNIGEVEESARQKWDKTQRRRRGVSQWIVRLLPFGLLIMLAVFYALSAPHTAAMLNQITPGWGMIAPVGFELGVLIVAALREAGWKNNLTLSILIVLLAMGVLINVAGGFIAVVSNNESTVVQNATILQLFHELPNLPATSQIVLVLLVIPIGSLIPFMAEFCGQALVKFSLNKINLTVENDEDKWLRDRRKLLQQALYSEAIRLGAGAVIAGNWSQMIVVQWYRETYRDPEPARGQPVADNPPAIGTPATAGHGFGFAAIADERTTRTDGRGGLNGQQVQIGQVVTSGDVRSENDEPDNGRTDGQDSGQSARNRNAREIVREYLRQNPQDVNANVRDLAARLRVGKTTVSAVQQEFRKSSG